MHWTKISTGYSLDGHTLTRKGRRWLLTFPGGRVRDLGTRASFPTAEAAFKAERARIKSARYLKDVEWGTLDADTISAVVAIVASASKGGDQ